MRTLFIARPQDSARSRATGLRGGLGALFFVALFALTGSTAPLAAQVGPQARDGLSIGARVGYDAEVAGGAFIVGAGARTSVPGIASLEIQALGDFTLLDNLTDRQFNIDVLWQFRGFALGGGPAFRNTLWLDSEGVRETRAGYSAVAIFGGQPGSSLLAAQLELRYTSVSDFSPQSIHLGINLPLLRW